MTQHERRLPANRVNKPEWYYTTQPHKEINPIITVGTDRQKETMALLNLLHYTEIMVCYLPDLIHTVNKLLGKW